MRRLIRFLFITLVTATAVVQFANAFSVEPGNEKFDILGLRLGMTASEAQAMIQNRLHLTPGATSDIYSVHPTPHRYQPEGLFVDEIVISNKKMELVLDFTEVFPGKASGPEALYFVSYTPKPLSSYDKDDFDERAVAKFGPPKEDRDGRCYWTTRPYQSTNDLDVTTMELDKSIPRLILSDRGIRRRMEDAYRESQKIPL